MVEGCPHGRGCHWDYGCEFIFGVKIYWCLRTHPFNDDQLQDTVLMYELYENNQGEFVFQTWDRKCHKGLLYLNHNYFLLYKELPCTMFMTKMRHHFT